MSIEASAAQPRMVPVNADGTLHLTLAVSEYDHTRDLTAGLIRPLGLNVTSLVLPIEEIFFRWLKNWEFDVSETSLAKYITLTAAGQSPIVGMPVFPARTFRHSAIYVRRDSGIRGPKDLEGKRVGIPEWAQTAGVYVRGMLSEYYGVALDKMDYQQASVNQPGRVEKVKFNLPDTIRYTSRPDKSISEMLETGEIDAAFSARPPAAFLNGHPDIVRLFPEFRTEEAAYFSATGIFPIMHVVAIRRDVFEAYPWVARSLYTAFDQAKSASVDRLREITTSRIPLPWGAAMAAEVSDTMGGDFWPYGAEANRITLEAFCRFAHDQFLTPRRLAIIDLFPRELLDEVKV